MQEKFWAHFQSRDDLAIYQQNALLLFALQLRYDLEDIPTVASEAITDGGDDKKADLVYIDRSLGVAVIAQGYHAQNLSKQHAPSNKASDLNTAVSWLLSRDISDIPLELQPSASSLRSAIGERQITTLEIWYVHNLPQGKNVRDELASVEHSAMNALKSQFPTNAITHVRALEVGRETIEAWYLATQTPIVVDEEFSLPLIGGYEIDGENWKSYVTAVQARWLYAVYQKHRDSLFSANVRGYLGSRKSDSNINHGIKETAEKYPVNFWVFNNGITALVHNYEVDNASINFRGISIVNGAQTTGAIGSLTSEPDESAYLSARFIKTSNNEIIQDIVRFNNSQNKVAPADFRSTDSVQERLRNEFGRYSAEITYEGGRRGGADDTIRRRRRDNHTFNDCAIANSISWLSYTCFPK